MPMELNTRCHVAQWDAWDRTLQSIYKIYGTAPKGVRKNRLIAAMYKTRFKEEGHKIDLLLSHPKRREVK